VTNLPKELTDLINNLRDGTISSGEERELLKMGSGWLYNIAELASEARDGYKSAVIVSKAVRARNFSYNRSNGESVSGAKELAESDDEYLKALDKERVAENEWRVWKGRYEAILEAVNSLKISVKYGTAEWKATGQGES